MTGGWLASVHTSAVHGQEVDPLRETSLVAMLRDAVPSVVTIYGYSAPGADGKRRVKTGSGSILHRDGYILTAEHVIRDCPLTVVRLSNGRGMQASLVAAMAAYDLAILKLVTKDPVKPLPLGRSDDLMLGEPVVAIGNPRGVGLTVSDGIVSGLNRYAQQSGSFLEGMIQTSAPIYQGNSGGPIVNAAGRQIGIALRGREDSDSLGLSVAVDQVRTRLPVLLAVEARQRFRTGLTIDPLVDPPTIASLSAQGPAAECGLAVGDRITAVDGQNLRASYDWLMALMDRRAGDALSLTVESGDQERQVELTLAEAVDWQPEAVGEALETGLRYETFQFDKEGFDNRLDSALAGSSTSQGVVNGLNIAAIRPRREYYAVRFDGFLNIPEEAVYTFSLGSDDGSRLFLGGKPVIENDGDHPAIIKAGVLRLKAGVYSMRMEYFQGRGQASLELNWQIGNRAPNPVPETAMLHLP